MAHATQPKALHAGAVTTQYDFCPAGSNGDNLFSVRAGIPLTAAFDELSGLLSASMAAIDNLACESNDTEGIPAALWQSTHLLNFSYALVQSIHGGHLDHSKGKS